MTALLTVKDCAELNLGIYGQLAAPVTWDYLDDGSADDGIYWGFKEVAPGVLVPVFRGSDSPEDWLRDLMILRKPWGAPRIGPVHPGMYQGMERVWAEFALMIKATDRIAPTGHSLGAPRSRYLSALMTVDGRPPTAMVRFASPRPGYQQLIDVCAPVPDFSFRNVDAARDVDDVTRVPFYLPGFLYVDAAATSLTVTPEGPAIDVFRLHHMALYAGAAPLDAVIPA